MVTYVALGSNLKGCFGGPLQNMAAALEALSLEDVNILKCSPWYSSPAYPDPSDPPYVNGVVALETALCANDLLARLHHIEASFGRIRRVRWESRVLDLDILDHREEIRGVSEAGPTLPHPRMENRDFVLLPLRDVAPEWHHPVTGLSVSALIAALPDPFTAEKLG